MYGGRLGAKSLHLPLNFAVNIKLLIKSNTSKCMHAPLLSRFQLFVTLWTDCGLPGFSVHGIFQARILAWVAISSSKGSSQPRIELLSPESPTLDSLSLSHLGSPVSK